MKGGYTALKKTYRCLVKGGHAGTGRYVEKVRYVKARTVLEAYRKAKLLPGVKKGIYYLRTGSSVLKVELKP